MSVDRLHGVHPALVDWAFRVVSIMDVRVIYGVRTQEEQRQLLKAKATRTMNSYHLIQSTGYGHAIDLAPYPIDWKDLNRFYVMGGIGLAIAHDMDLPVTWGRDWDGDMDFADQEFNDFLHWQLPRDYPYNLREA